VGFHETFWVIAGTAAPVIALAAVVSYSDLRDEGTDWSQACDVLRFEMSEKRKAFQEAIEKGMDETEVRRHEQVLDRMNLESVDQKYRRNAGWVKGLQLINLVVQATLLCVSLVSVANQANLVTPLAGVVAAVGGVLCLAAVANWLTSLKSLTREVSSFREDLRLHGLDTSARA
jgi:hypothetical protein